MAAEQMTDTRQPGPARARTRHPVRAALRFLAAVLITSGILMLADAGATLAWQEPISAFLAQQSQDQLGQQLDSTSRLFKIDARAAPTSGDSSKRIAKLAALWAQRARTGHAFGRIVMPTLHRSYVVVQGTDLTSLEQGPGHYPETRFPGQGGTVAIAGHRTTYLAPFRTINSFRAHDPIVLVMPYGRLTYRVERTLIVPPDAVWIERRVPGAERLVLSACHPLYSASHRIVVFARLVREDPA